MAARKNKSLKKKKKDLLQSTQEKMLKEKEFHERMLMIRRMLMMQEEEKRRISRDLHDETGQMVIALGASLNIIEKELKENRIENALKTISENRKLIQELAARMKSMAFNLRPPGLDILGLPAILREYFSQCTKSSPLTIEFNENIKDKKLDENLAITLYRIIQEAIHNAVKHSEARKIKIDLISVNKRLQLFIKDDGKGFNVEEYRNHYDPAKMGLRGIKERADILNGTFSIESTTGKGTMLKIDLPLES